MPGRGLNVGFPSECSKSGRTGNLKSFGRRRRTKVVDERTRGEQALVYGELNIYPMRETVRPPPRLVWCKGSLRHCCTRHRLVVVEW
jgi:hypothetical protein